MTDLDNPLMSAEAALLIAVVLAAPSIAVVIGAAVDGMRARQQWAVLVRSLRPYVSPSLLRCILAGRIDDIRGRRRMAFVFADIKGFTAWCESAEPEQAFDLLNRYFAAVTPQVHAHGGTIDNFRGDGLMALFGAPEPDANPCAAAFGAARAIVREGRAVLASCAPSPLSTGSRPRIELDLAIGIAFGDAVFGDLGSAERAHFSAIGDAANVAARLQDLSPMLGYPVLMTMDVVERTLAARLAHAQDDGVCVLGAVELRGHAAVRVAGWRPSTSRAASE